MFLCMLLLGCKPRTTARAVKRASLGRGRTLLERTYPNEGLDWHLVVYGREGIPLILPIDADMDDLRREVRTEGRYRLDPIDEHNRPIAGCPGGLLCIHEGEPAAECQEGGLVTAQGVTKLIAVVHRWLWWRSACSLTA
jgi:hypothetical protein